MILDRRCINHPSSIVHLFLCKLFFFSFIIFFFLVFCVFLFLHFLPPSVYCLISFIGILPIYAVLWDISGLELFCIIFVFSFMFSSPSFIIFRLKPFPFPLFNVIFSILYCFFSYLFPPSLSLLFCSFRLTCFFSGFPFFLCVFMSSFLLLSLFKRGWSCHDVEGEACLACLSISSLLSPCLSWKRGWSAKDGKSRITVCLSVCLSFSLCPLALVCVLLSFHALLSYLLFLVFSLLCPFAWASLPSFLSSIFSSKSITRLSAPVAFSLSVCFCVCAFVFM